MGNILNSAIVAGAATMLLLLQGNLTLNWALPCYSALGSCALFAFGSWTAMQRDRARH
jgi:hypothetical protein